MRDKQTDTRDAPKIDLASIVSRFEIGDPIKSLFRPKFDIFPNYNFATSYPDRRPMTVLRLTVYAPDAYGKLGVIPVNTERSFFAEDMEHMTEDYFLHLMREMLHTMLKHEADEAILFEGRRIFDPHKPGNRSNAGLD